MAAHARWGTISGMTETLPTPRTRRWPFLALGASAFAVLMTLGPMLATFDVDAGGSEQSHAGYNVGMMAARLAISIEAPDTVVEPAASNDGAAPASALAYSPAAVRFARAPQEQSAVAEQPTPLQSDAIEVTLDLLNPEVADLHTATWSITVSNQGEEYLWGVYAYLEGFGPVMCDDRQLDIGASTSCLTDQTVWTGEHRAVAWATAWTLDRMVHEEVFLPYVVGS